MFNVQNWLAAGLLLTLAFGVDDGSSTQDPNDAQAGLKLACNDAGLSRSVEAKSYANSERDGEFCRQMDIPKN